VEDRTDTRWHRIEEIVPKLLELDSAGRVGLLDEASGGDPEIRAQVKQLLDNYSSALKFFDRFPELLSAGSGPRDVARTFSDGEIVSQRFRIVGMLGEGGMGEVYEAEDSVLHDERVALKTLRATLAADEAAIARLSSELLIARRITSPNVCRVHDVYQHHTTSGARIVFFTMELLRGDTLADRLRGGRIAAADALPLLRQMAAALDAAHSANVAHGDFKPGNVMLVASGSGDDRVVVTDFGLARWLPVGSVLLSKTVDSKQWGTPAYMAPEQLFGGGVTRATDIYALGVVLYEMVTGHQPFIVELPLLFALKKLRHAPRLPRDYVDDLDPRWQTVILRCLDVSPEQRFEHAIDVVKALEQAPRRTTQWIAGAAALACAGAIATPPIRERVAKGISPLAGLWHGGSTATSLGPNAHADYLKAQDLLDHYYKPHNIDDAVAMFRKTVSEEPALASGYAGLGRALWWQYRDTHDPSAVEPAKAACSRALELDRESASAHVTLGMIYTDGGRTDLAAEELKEALRLNARSADAYSALAELYLKEGRSADVEPAIQEAIDFAPGAWRYLNQLGLYYLSAGRNDAAAEQFQRAATLNPDNARAYNNLGLAYARENRLADARMAYEKSLGIAPAYSALSNLGTILQGEGKDLEAVEIFRRAVEMNPSSYASWGNLASAQNRLPGNASQARETYLKTILVAEKAHANAPDDPVVISDLGSFYASVGMPEKSLPLLRQASRLAPENPQVLYRVAEGYELLHRRQDALKWIEKALGSGFSRETIDRNPELSRLRADPRFSVKPVK
jgi:tetratricopeptide (TPR) repeat protein/tRNA A-37 threonylcarbamoyl transferase component Bud32